MKYYYFNYYNDFNCIKDKCTHTCCANWQIDIDDKTLKKYLDLKEQHTFLSNGIDFEKKVFLLKENKDCFFLKNGLCTIIQVLGEKSLCETCKTHPRFKNYYNDRIEIGLGLCCEEAGRIILSSKEKMHAVLTLSKGKDKKPTHFQNEVLEYRDKIISVLQNRDKPILERVQDIYRICGIKSIDLSFFEKIFFNLERLDITFNDSIKALSFKPKKQANFSIEYENLLCYFAYRHISNAEDKIDLKTRTIFCLLAFETIKRLCDNKESNGCCSFLDLVEFSRQFSSEIEYSFDNFFNLLDKIEEKYL